MDDSPRSLSEQQKACLRLVGRGMSSKEIAQHTGLSPSTVDTYIKAAMTRIGAPNRRAAARQLAAAELPQDLGPQPAEVGVLAIDPHPAGVAVGGGWAGLIAPPPIGGRPNTLSMAERTFAMLRVAAIGLIVVVALALVVAGVFVTFR